MTERFATIRIGKSHICVRMRPNETKEGVRKRIHNSIWSGGTITVKGIYSTPWGKMFDK